MARLRSDYLLRGGSRLGVLNHRIDLHLQKISPIGHVLGDEPQVARLDEVPAESGTWRVPTPQGLRARRDGTACVEKLVQRSLVFPGNGLPHDHDLHRSISFTCKTLILT